jgi:hypothetical protein
MPVLGIQRRFKVEPLEIRRNPQLFVCLAGTARFAMRVAVEAVVASFFATTRTIPDVLTELLWVSTGFANPRSERHSFLKRTAGR